MGARHVTVYRVETADGEGPYQYIPELGLAHSDSETHPDILDDCLWKASEVGVYTYEYFCGCASLESLKAWFDGLWEILEESGCVVSEYLVPEPYVIYGDSGRQVAFKRDASIRVAKLPVSLVLWGMT